MTTAVAIKIPKIPASVELSAEWIEKRDALLAASRTFTAVADQYGYDQAGEALAKITKLSNQLETMRKDLSDPFREAAALIKNAADKARESLETEKDRLKGILAVYAKEQARLAEEERQRNEMEARAQAEKQLAEHQSAVELGLKDEAAPFTPVIAEPVAVVSVPTSSAVRMAESVTFELVDEDKVPRIFLTFDPRKVNAFIREQGEALKARIKEQGGEGVAEGLKFKIETTVQSKGRY